MLEQEIINQKYTDEKNRRFFILPRQAVCLPKTDALLFAWRGFIIRR